MTSTVNNIKLYKREKECEVTTRNELFRVGSGGGYCDHRSVGPGYVTRDLPWPHKYPTVYRDGPLVVIFVIKLI